MPIAGHFPAALEPAESGPVLNRIGEIHRAAGARPVHQPPAGGNERCLGFNRGPAGKALG